MLEKKNRIGTIPNFVKAALIRMGFKTKTDFVRMKPELIESALDELKLQVSKIHLSDSRNLRKKF